MEKQIFQICDRLAAQGVKPTLERVRNELGGGSFSTINPILKQWKENKEAIEPATITDLPPEIAAIGQKAAMMIWKASNDQSNELIKAIKQEAEQHATQVNNERDEALGEINRLEAENERLSRRAEQQERELNELRVRAELAKELQAKADEVMSSLKIELETAKQEAATLKGMLSVYESIGKQPEDEKAVQTKPPRSRIK